MGLRGQKNGTRGTSNYRCPVIPKPMYYFLISIRISQLFIFLRKYKPGLVLHEEMSAITLCYGTPPPVSTAREWEGVWERLGRGVEAGGMDRG
ncbi:hypothetical protein E2C01_003669 [Portunus trituberculatus]|uniref:Uncharacterized protein n=1 Tax=Portunus trituberculatus TaxID=210409 RepID=A0A5B7CP93_PORTR|nr:hypothetical protein [Portunus trituberculatus]